ncbi:hypothetical protein D3C84_794770 [compost metagenome]
MPGVSIGRAAAAATRLIMAARRGSKPAPAMAIRIAGLRQACPTLTSMRSMKPSPICAPRSASAWGRMKVGLTLAISVKTGIGSGRSCARRYRAMPPCSEPVKVTALINGWSTRASPIALPAPRTIENTPSGKPLSCTALRMARAWISEAPG